MSNLDIVTDILSKIKNFDESQMRVFMLCYNTETMREWRDKVPFISWGDDLEVRHYPAYTGALLRGIVQLKSSPSRKVSFYLDGYSYLGFSEDSNGKPIPYWEIYNISEPVLETDYSDTLRFDMNDIDGFVGGIRGMLYGVRIHD